MHKKKTDTVREERKWFWVCGSRSKVRSNKLDGTKRSGTGVSPSVVDGPVDTSNDKKSRNAIKKDKNVILFNGREIGDTGPSSYEDTAQSTMETSGAIGRSSSLSTSITISAPSVLPIVFADLPSQNTKPHIDDAVEQESYSDTQLSYHDTNVDSTQICDYMLMDFMSSTLQIIVNRNQSFTDSIEAKHVPVESDIRGTVEEQVLLTISLSDLEKRESSGISQVSKVLVSDLVKNYDKLPVAQDSDITRNVAEVPIAQDSDITRNAAEVPIAQDSDITRNAAEVPIAQDVSCDTIFELYDEIAKSLPQLFITEDEKSTIETQIADVVNMIYEEYIIDAHDLFHDVMKSVLTQLEACGVEVLVAVTAVDEFAAYRKMFNSCNDPYLKLCNIWDMHYQRFPSGIQFHESPSFSVGSAKTVPTSPKRGNTLHRRLMSKFGKFRGRRTGRPSSQQMTLDDRCQSYIRDLCALVSPNIPLCPPTSLNSTLKESSQPIFETFLDLKTTLRLTKRHFAFGELPVVLYNVEDLSRATEYIKPSSVESLDYQSSRLYEQAANTRRKSEFNFLENVTHPSHRSYIGGLKLPVGLQISFRIRDTSLYSRLIIGISRTLRAMRDRQNGHLLPSSGFTNDYILPEQVTTWLWIHSLLEKLTNQVLIHKLRYAFELTMLSFDIVGEGKLPYDKSWGHHQTPKLEGRWKMWDDSRVALMIDGILDTSLSDVLCLLCETDLHKSWIPFVGESQMKHRVGIYSQILSHFSALPWPLHNRESLIAGFGVNALSQEQKDRQCFMVSGGSVPLDALGLWGLEMSPPAPGTIRMNLNHFALLLYPNKMDPLNLRIKMYIDVTTHVIVPPRAIQNFIGKTGCINLFGRIEKKCSNFEGSKHEKLKNENSEYYSALQKVIETFYNSV